MNCPDCGKPGRPGYKFCSICGCPLPASGIPAGADDRNVTRKSPGIPDPGTDSTGSSFSLPPPPELYDGDIYRTIMGENPGLKEFQAAAEASGHRFFDPEIKASPGGNNRKNNVFISVASMIFIFVVMAGIPGYRYAGVSFAGKGVHTPFVNDEFMYSMNYMPPGWKMIEDAGKKAGDPSAAGYFFKGTLMNPDIRAVVYCIFDPAVVPEYISFSALGSLEGNLVKMNSMFMKAMGMEYEMLELKILPINNRTSLWMDGNGKCKRCENLRDFTFVVFCHGRVYLIKFLFNEKNVEAYWPEISAILQGLEFQ